MQERIITDDMDIKYIYCREDADSKVVQNDYLGAIDEYSAFLVTLSKKHHPDLYEGVLINIINCREAVKDYQGILKDYNELIKFKPNDANLFYFRGCIKEKLNDFAGAKKDYEEALQCNVNDDLKKSIQLCLSSVEYKQDGDFFKLLEKDFQIMNNGLSITNNVTNEQPKDNTESDFGRQLKDLEHDVINSNLGLSELNKRFQKLENEAAQSKNINFYLLRARFYDVSAQHDKNKIRQETLYKKAMQDYRQAVDYDPFVEDAPERIEEIMYLLDEIQSQLPAKGTLFSSSGISKSAIEQINNQNSKFNTITQTENTVGKMPNLRLAKK